MIDRIGNAGFIRHKDSKKELYFFVVNKDFIHKTVIRTGITSKKIPCYMRDSACKRFFIKKAKIF